MINDFNGVATQDKDEAGPVFTLNFVDGTRLRHKVRLVKYICNRSQDVLDIPR